MSAPTNQPTNNTNTADVPSAPPETHQRAGLKTGAWTVKDIREEFEVIVYLEAKCTNEHLDGPKFARVVVDASLLRRLLSMKEIREAHDLRMVSASWQTDAWGPGNIEERTRLISPRLVVDENNFWFSEEMKHSSAWFETSLEDVDCFVSKVLQAGRGQTLYFVSDEDCLDEVRAWQLEFGGDEVPCVAV